MQTVFKNVLCHDEPEILRQKLLPLSLGHVYTLLAVDSPYVCGGAADLMDLSIAVMICSRTWEQSQAWFHDKRLEKRCHKWGRKCRRLDFAAEQDRFTEYLDAYTQFPDRAERPDSKPCQHPWPLLIAQRLQRDHSESRVWNMPLPLALSYWSAEAEIQGDESLKNEHDASEKQKQIDHREKCRLEHEQKEQAG